MSPINKIRNIELITDVFSKFPTFHDAEVLSFCLHRGKNPKFDHPYIVSSIYVFEMTSEINSKNQYVLRNKSIVTFRFDKIFNLTSRDFNNQNVLQELKITQDSDDDFEVVFEDIFGLSAKFNCEEISVESVEPYSKD